MLLNVKSDGLPDTNFAPFTYRSGRAGASLRSRLQLGAKRLFEASGR